MQTYLTFATHPLLWVFLGLLIGFYLILWTASLEVPAGSTSLSGLQKKLGAEGLNPVLFLICVMMWAAVFLLLFAGLMTQIADIIQIAAPTDTLGQSDWRFAVAKLTALTAVFGAVVAFPVTLLRLELNRTQTDTAIEALFNDKINAAAADLYATRQKSRKVIDPQAGLVWRDMREDDVVRRCAAIDRLEGLVTERPNEAARIVRMLSTYVRELSEEIPPEPVPENADTAGLWDWLRGLKVKRPDMQVAVQSIGRLNRHFPDELKYTVVDLRNCNLQAMNLSDGCWKGAWFNGAALDKTMLQGTDCTNARFVGASLTATNIEETVLDGADFRVADIRLMYPRQWLLAADNFLGTSFSHVTFVDATIGSQFFETRQLNTGYLHCVFTHTWQFRPDQEAVEYTECALRGCKFHRDPSYVLDFARFFGDGSVTLPKGVERPAHWVDEELDDEGFAEACRRWRFQVARNRSSS
ncbi:pentapeptide repeat-containing protein [Seohaeicola saemankumensis]|nr:pentapeptide repeat-containing protein [Seohaeicola saemankumensis]MCA0872359.1 pentapeptide repeat-containing protein [Seohaeicola saemankumensis]